MFSRSWLSSFQPRQSPWACAARAAAGGARARRGRGVFFPQRPALGPRPGHYPRPLGHTALGRGCARRTCEGRGPGVNICPVYLARSRAHLAAATRDQCADASSVELLYTYRVARYRVHTLMLASVLPTAPLIASPHRPRRSHTGRGPCPNPNRRSPSARPPSSPRSPPPDARHAARHAGLRRLVDLPRCRLVVAAAWSYRCRW